VSLDTMCDDVLTDFGHTDGQELDYP